MLRPNNLNDIIGQTSIKQCLNILISTCKQENKPFPHMLYVGNAGFGKTTLSLAISRELNTQCHILNGANISNTKSLLPFLLTINRKEIIFIDEIHRMNRKVQESLYTALEDFRLDIASNIDLEPFTMIGATTDLGLLTKPFRDRFIHKFTLEPYTHEELYLLIFKNANKLSVNLTKDAAHIIVKRCKGVPRLANNLLQWIKDYSTHNKLGAVQAKHAELALAMLGIDSEGMDNNDRKYMEVLRKFNTPVGIKTIMGACEMDQYTIENTIEPYLLKQGKIIKTAKGRILA